MSKQRLWGCVLLAAMIVLPSAVATAQKKIIRTAPETFTSPLQARTELASSATSVTIHIERYLSDAERKPMEDALKSGGPPALAQAMRAASTRGFVQIGAEKFTVKWAREQATAKGRAVTLVTDTPIYFLGGGNAKAPSREGFDFAVIQLDLDEFGFGTGTMAAAAKVKSGADGGVAIEDYAAQPMKLTYVYRMVK